MRRTALILGACGQDGSYLTDLLIGKGYRVVGVTRRQSSQNGLWRIAQHLTTPLFLLRTADLCDQGSLDAVMIEAQPDEVYNLAAQSFVPTSWDQPVYTGDVDALGVVRVLESIRRHAPQARFVQASSSEMFGLTPPPQREDSPFHPRSPYACSKVMAHHVTVNYRESFGLHASCAISFNHGSPRRGPEFVEQKVAQGAAAIAQGRTAPLRVGNLEASRDWLHAKDVVLAMWFMAQAERPDDYVVASGHAQTIAELCRIAFRAAAVAGWDRCVEIDPALYRPAEVPALCGDPTKIRATLGWEPTISFEAMIEEMVAVAMGRPEAVAA